MLHPLFSVVIRRPDIVADHLAGYAVLAREEASSAGSQLSHRGIACAVTAVSLMVALVLAGMALMLGVLQGQFHWVLVVVPLVALAPAIWGWQAARKPLPDRLFSSLATQFEADMQVLRTSGGDRDN